VVYLAQQIHQFQLRGKEFAMQHLGTEDQMPQALRDFLASLPIEDRLLGLSDEKKQQVVRTLLASLPLEERLRGLSPEEVERLRQLLQTQAKPENGSRPE
jgi:hypothetical protein